MQVFDLVINLDVMEHLFDPFLALNEIFRTLKLGGVCLFSAPTEHGRIQSEQVAKISEDGDIVTIGEQEYHGNPQSDGEGALVTWRYGYDLPLLISRATLFDVEVRRWQSRGQAILDYMTEIYILRKT
jgi:SAM-dependent methyltransferase